MSLTSKSVAPCSMRCGWVGVRRPGRAASAAACCLQQTPRHLLHHSSRGSSTNISSRLACSRRASLAAWRIAAADADAEAPGAAPLVAVEGDIVTLSWKCFNEEGELLESSDQSEDPTTFEVGAGDIVGNRLFEAFDEAVRGLAVGDMTRLRAEGGEWKQELMFKVPRDHPEVQRLEGRYKNHGGVKEGLLVELANGGMALVVKADEEAVVLDANNMLAGKMLYFELTLDAIDRT